MKLIAFVNSYIKRIGGGDIHFIEVAKRLKNFDKVVVTPLLGKNMCKSKGLNAKYLITTKEKQFNNVFFTYIKRIIMALNLKIDMNDGDILYSSSDFLPDVLPAFVCKFKNNNVKWVALLHLIAPNPFYGYEQHYMKRRKVRFPTFNAISYKATQLLSITLMKWKADKILTLNNEMMNYLIKKGVYKDKISIIENGINYFIIQKIKPLQKDRYDAVFVGRFHPQKGIFDLIKIWELVCKQKKDVKIAIIGKGSEEFVNRVKVEIEEYQLENNIYLLGFLDDEQKFKVMKSSKIFMFPSFYESWGIVSAEAMACSLPVVCYDLPIYKEIFPKGMITVPIGDINIFAERVLELLNDEEFRTVLSNEAKEFIKKYDWEEISKKELKILNEFA